MNESFRVYIRQHPRFGRYYRAVETKPSWVVKAALLAAALVIVLPLVMLTLAAVVVGLAVFAALGLAVVATRAVRGVFERPGRIPAPPDAPPEASPETPPDAQRENVRVIRE